MLPINTGQERLRREVATLRQQLTAAETQLTVANRERGRLQQQVREECEGMNDWVSERMNDE